MLSPRNILASVDAVAQVFQLQPDDVMVGVLPFFHSFGFSITLWLPLISGFGAVFHPNPMDGKTIGEVSQRYHGTILLSTPTFYSVYIRECTREQLALRRVARRLVGERGLRVHRRVRVQPDHRPPVALQQDRGRDGAAHEGRGADPGAPRRAIHLRRHDGAR